MLEITNILDVEKHIDAVDAVIFDLDDTLYSEKQYVKSGFNEISSWLNIPDLANEMWCIFESGGYAIDSALKAYGLSNKKQEALELYRSHIPHIELYSGVREMLDRISQNKDIGIITDGRPEGQRAKLEALKINFDKIIITDELGGTDYRKPNPHAFERMREWCNIDYNKMVYIGDNIKKDFIAPKRLGMQCIWFKNEDGLYYK